MTTFDEGLWARLVAGHDADRVTLTAPSRRARRRPAIISASVAALAATTTAVALVLGATTGAPPAYALTQNPDGTVTVTVHDIETAVPALNAKFKQMGIDETVIPVKPGCTTPGIIDYPGATPTETITLEPGHAHLSHGYDGVLAAEQLPGSRVGLTIGAQKPPLPRCFSPTPLHLGLPTNGGQ